MCAVGLALAFGRVDEEGWGWKPDAFDLTLDSQSYTLCLFVLKLLTLSSHVLFGYE